MGGGGFTMEPENAALDEFILTLGRRPDPRICFLPTASGDADEQVRRFYRTFGDLPCEPSHLSLFRLGDNPVDPSEKLLAQDIVYVGGGSMRNMLAIWREHQLDRALVDCWNEGIVLAGLSAGAMCWFEAGVSKSSGHPDPVMGLGLLPGSLSVHLDGEPERRPVYLKAVRDGDVPPGWAADDGVGLLFAERSLVRAVSSRPEAGAIAVSPEEVREIEVDFIGEPPGARPRESSEVIELRSVRRSARSAGRRAPGGG